MYTYLYSSRHTEVLVFLTPGSLDGHVSASDNEISTLKSDTYLGKQVNSWH